MATCPYCQTDLPPEGTKDELCPVCGRPLGKDHGAHDQARPPLPDSPTGTATFDEDEFFGAAAGGGLGPDPGPEMPVPDDLGAEESPFRPDEDSRATFQLASRPGTAAGGETAPTLESIRDFWDNAVTDTSTPTMSLKPDSDEVRDASRTQILVRERRLAEGSRTHIVSHDPSLGGKPMKEGVLADFELLRMLGEGGMGTVFEAHQASIDRNIAIKMIKPQMAGNPQQREKFMAEAAVTGALDHPNIVPVHDLGADTEGRLYYAMKKVQGTPWSDVIAAKSLQENLEILHGVINAVAYAHNKGFIHRDLKPENVMLGEFGEVLVMDWGLAVSYRKGVKGRQLTKKTAAGGTPAYMAPEMAQGIVEQIGPRSDQYLLGAILYEIVTNRQPHQGKSVLDVLMAAAENRIAPATRGGELMEIARKAMSTHPRDRYPGVRDFQAAIREYQAHTESLHLVEEARKTLERARSSDAYDDYAQAVYACRQALDLWRGNREAASLLIEARAASAESALGRGDLDLADSVLDPDEPAHADIAGRIGNRRQERIARERRLRGLTRLAQGLALGVILILAVATVWIWQEYLRAEQNERQALDARNQALASLEVAEDERARAESARQTAENAREAEREQRLLAESAERKAREEEARAVEAEAEALAALEAVVRARSAEEAARARADAAEMMAEQVQEELSRSGLLRDDDWWTFDPAVAQERQAEAAAEAGLPPRRAVSLPGGEALEFALIPAGSFVMGSPADETDRAGGEHLHRVNITRPYYLAVHELTVAESAAVLETAGDGAGTGGGADAAEAGEGMEGAGQAPAGEAPDAGAPAGSLPRTDISWDEVKTRLLPALNRHAPEGFHFRLPTEAEWEYACRAGTGTPFYTGEGTEAMSRAGWYLFNSDRKIHSAGQKLPNPWGIQDLHGNVAEFCEDGFLPAFYLESPTDDPLATTDEPRRVVRGGSCLNLAEHCRSAYRSWAHRENRYKFLGVRLVMEPVAVPGDDAAVSLPDESPAADAE